MREVSGKHPCDKRRPLSAIASQFPDVDFSTVTEEEDLLYNDSVRESVEETKVRCQQFLAWLKDREEREVVLVSHSAFLRVLLQQAVNVTPSNRGENFNNCELRSFVFHMPKEDEKEEEKVVVDGEEEGA